MILPLMLLVTACPAILLTCLYASRRVANEVVTLHLTMFILEMYLYGAAWTAYVDHQQLTAGIVVLVGLLLNVYVGATLLLAGILEPFTGSLTLSALTVSQRQIGMALGAWLSFKTLLYLAYGAAIFGALDVRRLAGVPQWCIDIDRFLLWPAWGAYFAYIVKPRESRIGAPLTRFLFIMFLFINLFVENTGGGKRILLITALVFIVLRPAGLRLRPRNTVVWAMALVAAILMANYYESVRLNFGEIVETLQSNKEVTWEALQDAFIPRPGMGLVEDFEVREAPFSLLHDLTKAELGGTMGGGAVFAQVLENVLPNGVFNKHFADEDGAISAVFNLPAIDLATTNLAVVQSETYFFAYVLTPAIYLAAFWLLFKWLSKWLGKTNHLIIDSLMVLAILGALIETAVNVEASLTGTVATLRDIAGLLVFAYLLDSMTFSGRRTVLTAPSEERSTRAS